MTRFSETEKWRDPWFRALKPSQKLLFLFVIDNCNNAGFWEEDKDYAMYCTGMNEEQYLGALKGLTRGLVGADGWLWVRKFLKHQRNSELNPNNHAHTQIIRFLREQKLRFTKVEGFAEFLAPYEGLLSPPVKYSNVKTDISSSEEEAQEKKGNKKAVSRITVIDPLAIRVAALVGRRSSTPWLKHEWDKFLELKPEEPEVADLEWFYSTDYQYKKQTLSALLNEWLGEIDKATAFSAQKPKQRYSPNL